jgi:siroheme synthase
LTAHGLAAATPVVVMASITRTDEAVWTGTLETLGSELAASSVLATGQPLLIGIGRAFAPLVARA